MVILVWMISIYVHPSYVFSGTTTNFSHQAKPNHYITEESILLSDQESNYFLYYYNSLIWNTNKFNLYKMKHFGNVRKNFFEKSMNQI